MWPFSSPYPQVRPEHVGRPLHPFESNTPGDEYTYDYIIVGGGTAGCVLASRLSENPDISVLVLERGPIADTWANSVPLISGSLRPDTLAKKFMSAPFAHDQREVIMVRAEGLGGGSRINGMLYNRGVPGDYNRWRDMGHPEWSYEKLLPYFVKSETSLSHPTSPARGKTGPWINQKYPNSICRSIDVAKTAAYNLGMPEVADFNDPSAPPIGTWDVDTLQYPNRKRCSVFHAFLPHAVAEARAAHLKICTETLVQRIVFEKGPDGRSRAVGVEFGNADPKRKGKVFFARVRKEVIVCSGAIGSPQVLMLSGIGPAEHLRSYGIDVVFDNPGVGSHFKDHPGVPLIWGTPVDDSFRILLAKPWRVALSLAQYLLTGGGIMSSPWASVAIFLPSKHISPTGHVVADPNPGTNATPLTNPSLADPANVPDIEILPIPVDAVDPRADFPVPAGAFSLLVTLLNPRSTGTVRLRSGDPADAPVCDIGLVREEGDFGALRKGVRLGMRVAGEMGRLGYGFVGREGEGASVSGGASGGGGSGYPEEEEVGRTGALLIPANTSDAAIDAFIRENARSTYHYSSSCRMAPFEDPAAPGVVGDGVADSELWVPGVVDDELRVHGVRGVRVCDTSAVPDIVAAHPMAVAVVMAEKCADMILRGL